jgi:hypothetical protein
MGFLAPAREPRDDLRVGRVVKADTQETRQARVAVLARDIDGQLLEVGTAYRDTDGQVVYEIDGRRLPRGARLVLRARVP